jgi:putative transcription factor
MVQCEMCGTETGAPKTVKIEGAELQVCADCAEFGTEVRDTSSSSGSTKYSTSSSSSSGSGASGSGSDSSSAGSSGSSSSRRRRDMFDQMDELAQDYDQRIRGARESRGLSQEELAKQLNEKASLIRKLERGDVLPSDGVQRKLERELDITLSESGGEEGDTEWSGGSATGGTTLGDVVKRRD